MTHLANRAAICLFLSALFSLPALAHAEVLDGTYRILVSRMTQADFARTRFPLRMGRLRASDSPRHGQPVSAHGTAYDGYAEFRTYVGHNNTVRVGVRAGNRFWRESSGRVVTGLEGSAGAFTTEAIRGIGPNEIVMRNGEPMLLGTFVRKIRAANGRYLRVGDDLQLRADGTAETAHLFHFFRIGECNAEALVWDQKSRRNLAFGKPTRQSSTFSSGGGQDRASNGVDGDTCGRFAQTRQESGTIPFWEVDLGAEQWVQALLVYRGNASMNGAIVATSSTVSGDALMVPGEDVTHYRLSSDGLTVLTPPFDQNVPGIAGSTRQGRVALNQLPRAATRHIRMRYIRIFHPKKSGQISLHELVVVGHD